MTGWAGSFQNEEDILSFRCAAPVVLEPRKQLPSVPAGGFTRKEPRLALGRLSLFSHSWVSGATLVGLNTLIRSKQQ